MNLLNSVEGFDWDEGNSEKNWISHRVSMVECEQVFYHEPLVVDDDLVHSLIERRLHARGQTDSGRRLFVTFTMRGNLIRIISARPMDRVERKDYDEEIKKAS